MLPDTVVAITAIIIMMIAGAIYWITKNKIISKIMERIIDFIRDGLRSI